MDWMKDMSPDEYRQKHRRCSTCKHCSPLIINHYCNVKGKPITLYSLTGMFCRCYDPKPYVLMHNEMR